MTAFSIAAAFVATSLPMSVSAQNEPPQKLQWKRTPELVVPFIKKAPKIDGRVDKQEWAEAAELGPFKVGTPGMTELLERKAWLAYDDKNIYLAFSFERPYTARKPMVPSTDGRFEGQVNGPMDVVEALFAPQLKFNDSRSFLMYCNGAYADAQCLPYKKTEWNAEWQRGARVTETGWEGEIAIPFAAFGLSGPPPADQYWGFDVVDNRATPFRYLAHWSYRGDIWHAFENFGRIRFDKVPAVRFLSANEQKNGTLGIDFAIFNPGPKEEKIHFDIEALRRKDGEEGGPKSYYENIHSGLSQGAQQEFTKGVTLDSIVEFAQSFYVPVSELTRGDSTVSVAPGKTASLDINAKMPYGEYLVDYTVKTETGVILARGSTVFRSDPPLALRVEPYWLYSEAIDVFADLTKTGLQESGDLILRIYPNDGKKTDAVRESRTAVNASQREAQGVLDVKGLPIGPYRVEAVLVDAKGSELARNEYSLERPEFPKWFKNDIGNKIEVPRPWTPVEASADGKVSMWGRVYDLSAILPSSVTSQGAEVLSGAVKLATQTSGGPVAWKVEKVKLQSATPGKAIYDVAMTGSGLRVAGTVRVEFDGLVWYDLTLSSLDGAVTVESMKLDIPVAAKFCELMSHHRYLEDPAFSSAAPKPLLNGAPGLLTEAKMPFTPYLWIGNEDAGMGFIAEAPIDWQVSEYRSLLETLPATKDTPGRIIANIIQKPKEVSKPLRLQFGLQATPIRKPTEDRSILNISQRQGVTDNEQYFADIAKKGGKVLVFYHDWTGNPKTQFGGTPERPADPANQAKLKSAVANAHKYGLKVLLFTGWGVNASSEAWKKYSYELASYPFTNQGHGTYGSCSGPNGGYVDFMAWGHADLAREYGVDGVLWDSAANIGNVTHPRIGEAWVDEEGRVRPKFAVLATRDLYRRIYNIYNGEVRDNGVIYNHMGSLWPVNVFADMQNRGEGRPMRADTLRECWIPFEEFRSEYAGDPFGTFHSGEVNDGIGLPMSTVNHAAVTLLHGTYAKTFEKPEGIASPLPKTYGARNSLQRVYWETFNWVPMDGTEKKFFYYKNLKGKYQAVRAEPDSLLSSAFVSGDGKRAVIVISNLDKKKIEGAKVFIDPASIGMPAGKPLHIEDAITREIVAEKDGTILLDIEPERFRLLKVSVE